MIFKSFIILSFTPSSPATLHAFEKHAHYTDLTATIFEASTHFICFV